MESTQTLAEEVLVPSGLITGATQGCARLGASLGPCPQLSCVQGYVGSQAIS